MVGIASAATSVLIGYLAANTTTLHLGSGGVMLPNHSPLVIAEQFGTLNTLYPGRIDLGLGRAPGSDQPTMRALRRHMSGDIDNFPRDVAELVDWFDAAILTRRCARFRATARRSRCGCWVPACTAHSWRRSLACRLPPRTSRRICCSRRCISTARTSPSARLETVRNGVHQHYCRRQ
jgi:luciferase family oxidoreductase group 1